MKYTDLIVEGYIRHPFYNKKKAYEEAKILDSYLNLFSLSYNQIQPAIEKYYDLNYELWLDCNTPEKAKEIKTILEEYYNILIRPGRDRHLYLKRKENETS